MESEAKKIKDLSKLCIHTITTKPLDLKTAVKSYQREGIGGITVWRDALMGLSHVEAGKMIREHGLDIVSYCRGGFFPAKTAQDRRSAIYDNERCVDEAAALGAPMVVLVCGAVPGQPLSVSRQQIQDGIEAVLPRAEKMGVKLAIEPLHPMYADDRSAVTTMKQANDLCEAIDSPLVGVAVDVYHLWWDEFLKTEIERCGRLNKLFAFHICDWKTPTEDLLLDRGLMGEGCINIKEIRGWVEKAGFKGYNEVEIFSEKYWSGDQQEFLKQIKDAYLHYS